MNTKKKDYCVRKAFESLRSKSNSNSNSRRIVDLKTGKTRQEEEYEKTIRLLNLMKGPR